MKKKIAITAAFVLSIAAMNVSAASAEDAKPEVYVTISDKDGNIALSQEKIELDDYDKDGALTINDALYIAHDKYYEGGADGFASSVGQWGLGMDKLWGNANGGSYGYYVNGASAWSLTDALKDGDYLDAFTYTDLTGFSDTYTFFDVRESEAEQDGEVVLTLKGSVFDGTAMTDVPIEGAKITINGEASEAVTDADGKASVKGFKAGKNIISAESESRRIVHPISVVNVAGETEPAVTTTTAPAVTTAAATTAASATKPAAATTKPSASNSPKTGDMGAGAVAAFAAIAVATAFVCRRRED